MNGNLAGFCAVLPFPHPKRKNTWKGHRTVVFPDYQGVGIGRAFTNFVAQKYKNEGKRYISTTSNPAMIFARKKDKNWRTTHIGRLKTGGTTGMMQTILKKGSTSSARITVSFEYIGGHNTN